MVMIFAEQFITIKLKNIESEYKFLNEQHRLIGSWAQGINSRKSFLGFLLQSSCLEKSRKIYLQFRRENNSMARELE